MKPFTIKDDEYGIYFEYSDQIKERIRKNQEVFLPFFLDIYEKYSKYEEWKYLDKKHPFVFSPLTLKVLSKEIIPNLINEFLKSNELKKRDNISLLWSETNIEGILNKLLAFESFYIERKMANN